MANNSFITSTGSLSSSKPSISQFTSMLSNPAILATLLTTYLLLVRLLRHQRLRKQNATLPPNSPLSSMTVEQAQTITLRLSQLEFPFVVKLSLQFALFRTYGIPSISELLCATSLFSEPVSASKRYADTTALIAEMMVRPIGSADWTQSLARLNCIHGKYKTSGRISNDDFLYTLALFAREPPRFIGLYEWRSLSDVELCGIGIYWKTIGDAMQIEMKGLKTYDQGSKWRDGKHWFDELCAWAETYEQKHMLEADSNVRVASETTAILLWNVPLRFHPLGKNLVAAMMDLRLRKAMRWPAAPLGIEKILHAALEARKFVLKHLVLPRWKRYFRVTRTKTAQDTYFLVEYDSLPYYVRPTLWNRWNPKALVKRWRGQPVPGDEGDKYFPQGYRVLTVGPEHGFRGQRDMERVVKPVGERRCPVAFG